MTRERTVFHMIFKNFIRSIIPNFSKNVSVGKDYLGTEYFENVNPKTSHKRPTRYFVPADRSNFEQELPAEWEAWLRHRRDNPPTTEEVMKAYEMILLKKKNAAEIKATFQKPSESDSLYGNNKSQSIESQTSFPIYEEYKNYGRNYKKSK